MKITTVVAVIVVTLSATQCFAQGRPKLQAQAAGVGEPDQEEKAKKTSQRPQLKPGGLDVGEEKEAGPTPVALADGVATLSPENSKVEFVGKHEGDEPKPRLGGFAKFSGSLKVDDAKAVSGLEMEFDTTSLWTEIGDNLTNHLKNEDFLDVEKHPKAMFKSTAVKAGENGAVDVTGDFTLMGETKEISFPAKVEMTDSGVTLLSDFEIDRTMFGMNKMTERVSKGVAIKVSVGEKTAKPKKAPQMAGGRGQGGRDQRGGRRGGGDPKAFFDRMDADKDGKLTKDEMPERMAERFDSMDADEDGSVTLEEMQKMFSGGQRGGGRGQRGGRGGQRGGGGQ